MTYLTGMLALDIKAGAPNRGNSHEDNFSGVKTTRIGRNTHPYIAAQAIRRWWRDTLAEQGFPPSPVTRWDNKKATTAARGDLHADDDLFGYMATVARGTTIQRNTVLATGTALSVRPQQPTRDWGTMSRGFQPGDQPLPHQHDHYTTELAMDLRLNLSRVGRFQIDGIATPDLADDAITEALDNGATETTIRGHRTIELPLDQRRTRTAGLWRALAELDGGATLNMHYGSRTPALIVLAPLSCGANPFTRILRAVRDETRFDHDILREQLHAWDDRITGDVRIGWEPGFLHDQRDGADGVVAQAEPDIDIQHPRTMLRTLANDIESGKHDDWFEAPA